MDVPATTAQAPVSEVTVAALVAAGVTAAHAAVPTSVVAEADDAGAATAQLTLPIPPVANLSEVPLSKTDQLAVSAVTVTFLVAAGATAVQLVVPTSGMRMNTESGVTAVQ